MIEACASTWDALWALLWPFRGPRLCRDCMGWLGDWRGPICHTCWASRFHRERAAELGREARSMQRTVISTPGAAIRVTLISDAPPPTADPGSGRPVQA